MHTNLFTLLSKYFKNFISEILILNLTAHYKMSKDLKSFVLLLTHNVLHSQSSSSPYSDKLLDNIFFLLQFNGVSLITSSSLKLSSASLKLYQR